LTKLNQKPKISYYKNHSSNQIPSFSELLELFIGEKNNGFFVEVGGFDGKSFGCTIGLSKRQWSGIYIEPVPKYARKIQRNHKNNPNVQVIQSAVGASKGLANLSLRGPLTYVSRGKSNLNTISVEMDTLDEILIKNKCPIDFDVLVIDTEGSESEVLKGFSILKWNPKIIVIELHDTDTNNSKVQKNEIGIYQYLLSNYNYLPMYKDWINTVFVRNDLIK